MRNPEFIPDLTATHPQCRAFALIEYWPKPRRAKKKNHVNILRSIDMVAEMYANDYQL